MPDPVRLVGVRVHVRPVAGEMEVVRATTPPNPLRPVIVMVEDPATFAVTVMLAGLAVSVKSWTV